MFNKKVYGIMIIIALAAGISITTTRCYDDDKDARVTIHLERNDLAAMGIEPEKHFIDRVLEFFSTPAEAVSPWPSDHGNLTLYINSPSFEEMSFSIPSGSTEYSVVIPSANQVKFTVISVYSTQKNWGGHTTLDLGPGDQDITVNMIPMVVVYQATCCNNINWYDMAATSSFASGYFIYRSNNLNGPYAKIDTINNIDQLSYTDSFNLIPDTTYYYKISVFGPYGEGVLSDALQILYHL